MPPLRSTGADRTTGGGHRRRRREEDRGTVSPTQADEQPPLGAGPVSERVDAPVDDAHRALRSACREVPLRRPAELGATAGGKAEVPGADERRRHGPAAQRAPNALGRVASRPLSVHRDGDHSRRAGTDLQGSGQRATEPPGPDRSIAMPIALPAGRRQSGLEHARDGAASRHRPAAFRTVRNQSLAKRSRHARAVRGTISEKPVRRCSTLPSAHSRNTWGMR